MTTLELKQVSMRNGQLFDYKTQAAVIVRSVAPLDAQGNQKRGFNERDMDDAEELASKIEAANGHIELTAAETMQLVEKVQLFPWPFSDPAFREFVRDLVGLRSQ
jgi:hypothetical protein